jgi:hypothetical protein
MGSSAPHSTGRKAGATRARKGRHKTTRRKAPPPDVDAVLERLSDSLSIIATAASALVHAQEQVGTLTPHDSGEPLTTLEHGVQALRGALDELDVAYRILKP